MAEVEWYTIVIPLISGGAVGGIITSVVSAYRSRIQPVGRRIEYLALFRDTPATSSLRAKITVFDGQKDYMYDNLHVGQIQLINRGNKDFKEFAFGVTLTNDDVAISMEPQSLDRHHQVIRLTSITPSEPKAEIDFVLKPFNRGDTYALQLFIVTPPGREQPGAIQLSSSEAIRFVNIPTIAEISIAPTLKFGPLTVSLAMDNR